MSEQRGPGHTSWHANDDGTISVQRWNYPEWRNGFMSSYDMNPSSIAMKLREAYEMGRRDQAELVRRAVNFGERQ